MAEKEIAFKFKVETSQANRSLKDLEAEFNKINEDLAKLKESGQEGSKAFDFLSKKAEKFGEILGERKQDLKTLGGITREIELMRSELEGLEVGSDAFNKLSKEITEAERGVKNLELSMESLDNEQVASELGSVAGAVGDVSAAFVLLGDDSEAIEEVAKNIETALGVSMAFKGAIEGVSSARKLLNNSTMVSNVLEKVNNFLKVESAATSGAVATAEGSRAAATTAATTATGGATASLSLLRVAFLAVPIFAIIGGLVALVMHFDKVKEAVKDGVQWLMGFKDRMLELGPVINTIIGIMTLGLVPIILAMVEAIEYFGVVETEEMEKSRKRRAKQLDTITRETEKKVALIQKEIDAEKKKADEITSALDWEIEKKKAAGEDYAELEKQKLEAIIRTTREQAKLLEQQIRAEAEALVAKNKIIAQGTGFAATVAQKALEEFGDGSSYIEQLIGNDESLAALNATLDQAEKDLELFNIKQEKLKKDQIQKNLEAQKKANDEELKLMKEHMANLEQVQARSGEIKIEQADKEKDHYILNFAEVMASQIELEHEATRRRREEFEKRLDNAESLTSSLNNLNQTLMEAELNMAGDNEEKKNEIRKKAFRRDKALKLAQATIDGIRSVQAALTIPPPLGFVLAGINTATALANIAKISSAKFEGETGASGTGGGLANTGRATQGANVPTVTNTTTSIGEPTKVFVTEQDITNTQNKVTVAENQATL